MLEHPLIHQCSLGPDGRSDRLPRLYSSTRGAVSIEYLIVVAVIGLSLSTTLIALGRDAVQTWSNSRRVLYGASP